LELIVRTLIIR